MAAGEALTLPVMRLLSPRELSPCSSNRHATPCPPPMTGPSGAPLGSVSASESIALAGGVGGNLGERDSLNLRKVGRSSAGEGSM
jgi:hypothetical protein